jgi:hypothetical protein
VNPTTGDETVELGGCQGCSLGCAVACERGDEARAQEARQVLIGSGVGVVMLSIGPGLVARQPLVLAVAVVTAALGVLVAVLAGLAVRAGRPDGDVKARGGFHLLPAAMVGVLITWLGAVIARLP